MRVDGRYLADVLKASGGMMDFELANSYSHMLSTVDSYRLVVMPMMSANVEEQAKQGREAKAAEVQAEPSAEAEAKPKKRESGSSGLSVFCIGGISALCGGGIPLFLCVSRTRIVSLIGGNINCLFGEDEISIATNSKALNAAWRKRHEKTALQS